jgi:hypothetical protein
MIHRLFEILTRAILPATGRILNPPAGYLIGWGTTVGNGIEGWAPSAIFFDVDGTIASVNAGTKTTADWKTITHA